MSNINVRVNKRLCTYLYPDNKKCNCIALTASDYCRHHAPKEIIAARLISQAQNRYSSKNLSVRQALNTNLASPSLLDLRHEIALLQAWLQELMDAPVSNFEKQLQVIDRIEKLVTNFQRIRLSAQALAQAENKVRLVINNVVLILKDVVTDKEQRQEIARRLAALGQQYETEQQSAALNSVLIQEEASPNMQEQPINCINTQAQEHASARAQAQAGESGDPAPGKETEQDIAPPCPDAPSTENP